MGNGAADVPQISKSQRDRRRTIGCVSLLNATGVLQYVLSEGRPRLSNILVIGVLLEDPRFAKKMQKSIRPKTKKLLGSTACGTQQHSEVDKKQWKFMNEQTRCKKTRQNPLVIPDGTRTRVKMEVVKMTVRKQSEKGVESICFSCIN